jgi:hypothetical protein
MTAVATEWPLSGQPDERHHVDHAKRSRKVFGITVFRFRISANAGGGTHLRSVAGRQDGAHGFFASTRTGMQLCERLNLLNQATNIGV